MKRLDEKNLFLGMAALLYIAANTPILAPSFQRKNQDTTN
jgi:hypothetical protein